MKTGLRHIRNVAGDAADGLDGGRCKLLVGTADVGPELSKDGVDARLSGNVGKNVQLHVGRRRWEGSIMARKNNGVIAPNDKTMQKTTRTIKQFTPSNNISGGRSKNEAHTLYIATSEHRQNEFLHSFFSWGWLS